MKSNSDESKQETADRADGLLSSITEMQEADVMTETVKLSNGVSMPMEGFGVFQIPEAGV